jgi:hypothetical protein
LALQPAQMLAALQTDLAGRAAIKLSITREGWYKVSQPDLLAAGLAPRTAPRFLQLFVDGQELPIRVTGENDGSFDPTDAIELDGIGIDSPYTNRHTYWLTGEQKLGKRIIRADMGKGYSSPSNFLCTVERRRAPPFDACSEWSCARSHTFDRAIVRGAGLKAFKHLSQIGHILYGLA